MNKIDFANIRNLIEQFEIESQKLFGQFEGNPHRIDYLNEMIANIESLQDEAKKDFSEEVVGCFKQNFFRPAIILTWCTVITYLENICLKYSGDINKKERALLKKKHAHLKKNQALPKKEQVFPKNDLEKMRDEYHDSRLIGVMQEHDLITKQISKNLTGLLHERNTAAHPSDEYPSQTITLAFIEKAVNTIKKIEKRLKDKPPFQN